MDPDRLRDRGRKRKSSVTPQSASPKRRGPGCAASPSRTSEELKVGEHPEEHASTSHEAPSSDTIYLADEVIKKLIESMLHRSHTMCA